MQDETHHTSTPRQRWLRGLIITATAIALLRIWLGVPTDYPIVQSDAYENLTAAYNLVHHGVISIDDEARTPDPQPSQYREPLPIMALAGYISTLPQLADRSLGDLVTLDARVLKYSNIIWGTLLSLVVFGTIVRWTGSYAWGAFGTIATHMALWDEYNGLYTEVIGATILALTSLVAATAARERTWPWMLATGLMFGAMALTKAAFLYVAIGLIACVAAWGCWRSVRARDRSMLHAALLLAVGLAVMVAPWMARNYAHFGSVSLSNRGGIVLYTRALKNGMTAEEYRGAWFAYAPRPLRWVTSQLTGYNKRDLQEGGRLMTIERYASPMDRLAVGEARPEMAVSYFAKVKALRDQLRLRYPESGPLAIDRIMKREAFEMLKADPLRHLGMTPLFIWRGAPYVFLILCAGALYGWTKRQWWLLAYLAPALAMVAFYGLLTHFIPRYGAPMTPIAAVVFAVLGYAAWSVVRTRLSAVNVPRIPFLAALTTEPRMTEANR